MAAGRKAIDISEWLTPENKLRIQGWCRDGLIEKQIYKNMGIGKSTFYKWKNENVEFAELLKESKETADREVENGTTMSLADVRSYQSKHHSLPDKNGVTSSDAANVSCTASSQNV